MTIEAAAFSNWRVSWRLGHVDIAHGASGKDEDGLSFLRTESASLAASLTCRFKIKRMKDRYMQTMKKKINIAFLCTK